MIRQDKKVIFHFGIFGMIIARRIKVEIGGIVYMIILIGLTLDQAIIKYSMSY